LVPVAGLRLRKPVEDLIFRPGFVLAENPELFEPGRSR